MNALAAGLALRRQMPVVEKWAYFDHAAVCPLPGPVHDAMTAWAAEAAAEGVTVYPDWLRRMNQTRAAAARLLNADVAEVALIRSTTEGINLVAEGFPWQAGDNLVTLENEFPSNLYPWLNQAHRGVEVRRVATTGHRVDLDKLRAACDARTRIVSLSWVGYASGWRTDLAAAAEMAHAAGALFFVDAIQGLGVFPLDVAAVPLDFLAADGHKWLLGPEGAGLFFIRRQHLELLRPVGVGWNSVARPMDYSHIELKYKPTAARFEGGRCNVAGILGLGASLELLASIGAGSIAARVLEITDLACERLLSIGARIESDRQREHRSGIVLFEMPGQDPLEVRHRCLGQGVALGCRAGRLRISPHAYVNEDDVERLVAGLVK
jgi:selenocysteine lyase/cysteine desulfurase